MAAKRLTEKQGVRAGKWICVALKMEDWDVSLCVSEDRPKWADNVHCASQGCCLVAYQTKDAAIWVHPSPDKDILTGDGDPLATLFHEYLHVFAADVEWENVLEPRSRASEQAICALSAVFAAAYRAKVKV